LLLKAQEQRHFYSFYRPQALCCTGAGWPATDGPDTIDFSFAFSLTCSAMPGNLEK
jgi:hypothetical protein